MTGSTAPARPAPRVTGVERALGPKRQKYQAEFDLLVTAARGVMTTQGSVDATVAQVLEAAGLSTSAFYRHFPTKDDLLLELVKQAGANTRAFLSHRLDEQTTAPARVRAWIEGMFALLGTKRALRANRPFLLAHPRLVERFPDEIERNIELLVGPLADAIGDIRQPGEAAIGDALLIHHQVFGILLDRAAMNRLTDPTEVERVVEFSFRALRAGD